MELNSQSPIGESSTDPDPAKEKSAPPQDNEDSLFSLKSLSVAIKSITIEPIVFVHLTAIFMTSITTIDLILERACSVNNNFAEDVCLALRKRNLSSEFHEYDVETSKVTTTITIWKSAVETVVPVVFALFAGPRTDVYGRKFLMLFSMGGSLVQLFGLYLCSFTLTWKAEIVAAVASVPVALTGSQVVFNMCLFAYIVDTTTESMRSIKLGMTNATWFLGVSSGLAVGAALAKPFGSQSIYGTALALEFLCFWCVLFFIENTKKVTTDTDTTSMEEASEADTEIKVSKLKIKEVLHWRYILNGVKAVFRKREDNGRTKIILMLIAVIFTIGPHQGDSNLIYLFVRGQVNWTATEFGFYGTYRTVVGTLGTILSVVGFSYYLKLTEPIVSLSLIGFVSGISQFSSCFMYAFATSGIVMYLAPLLELVNGSMMIIARTLIPKLTAVEEQGQVQSLVTSLEAVVPMITNPIYGFIFRATSGIFAGTFFLVSAVLVVPSLIIFGLVLRKKWKEREVIDDSDERNCIQKIRRTICCC